MATVRTAAATGDSTFALAAWATGLAVAWLGVVVPGALVTGPVGSAVGALAPWLAAISWLLMAALDRVLRRPLASAWMVGALVGTQAGQTETVLGPALLVASVTLVGAALGRRGVRVARGLGVVLLLVGMVASLQPSPWRDRPSLRSTSPSPPSILMVGIDGLDPDGLARGVAAGELPHLSGLVGRGAWAPLHTLIPTSSPYLWNSIVTGVDPSVHRRRPVSYALGGAVISRVSSFNLVDLVARTVAGEELRMPFALWDVLEQAGYDTAVAGAWESSPVPTSGELFLAASAEHDPKDPTATLRRAVNPAWIHVGPSLRTRFDEADRAPKDLDPAFWARVAGRDPGEMLAAPMVGGSDASQRAARMVGVLAADQLRTAMSVAWWPSCKAPCFGFTYLRSVDMAQHGYAHQLRGQLDPADLVEDGLIGRVHAEVDAMLGALLAAVPPDTIVVVVSDHGLDLDEVRAGGGYKTGWHDFAPDGTAIVAVPGRGVGFDGPAHLFDVTPTVLALAGLPMLADMEGHVWTGVAPRQGMVDDYLHQRPTLHETGNPRLADPEVDAQLEAIGYLGP